MLALMPVKSMENTPSVSSMLSIAFCVEKVPSVSIASTAVLTALSSSSLDWAVTSLPASTSSRLT